MNKKKITIIFCIICLSISLSACSVKEIKDEDASTAYIDRGFGMWDDFESWTPLEFKSGQTMNYDFEISTGQYIVNGKFALTIRGKAPAGLRFAWKFSIGKESKTGSCSGTSANFIEKFRNFCSNNPIYSTVYTALFVPYNNMDKFNKLITDDNKMQIGQTWKSSSMGEEYLNKFESIDNHGGVDGFTVASYLDEAPEQIICISPFISLPSMSMFFLNTNSEDNVSTSTDDAHVVCVLSKIIL